MPIKRITKNNDKIPQNKTKKKEKIYLKKGGILQPPSFFYKKRFENNMKIKELFQNLTNGCIAKNRIESIKTLNNYIQLTNIQILSCGETGTIYNAKLENHDVILKLQNSLINEEQIMINLNVYLSNKILYNPHFIYFYKKLTCNDNITTDCDNRSVKQKIYSNYVIYAIEKFDKSLNNYLQENIEILNIKKMKNIITQIIISIYSFHKYTKNYHNDTNCGNFLIKHNAIANNKYNMYIYNTKQYVIKSSDLHISISDYGMAKSINIFENIYNLDQRHNYIVKTTLFYDYYFNLSNIISILSNKKLSNKNINITINYIQSIINIIREYDNYLFNMANTNIINNLNILYNIQKLDYNFFNTLINKKLIDLKVLHKMTSKNSTIPPPGEKVNNKPDNIIPIIKSQDILNLSFPYHI